MLNEQDLKQLESKGITKDAFLIQIKHFKTGFPSLKLKKPATIGDGIRRMEEDTLDSYSKSFDKKKSNYRVLKFVPASGAATRMFKDVFAWRDLLIAGVEPDDLLDSKPEARRFFERMRDFAFWDDLKLAMDKDDLDADHLLQTKNFLPLIDYLLFDPGLDYAVLPKALIAFHSYGQDNRTSLEEHLAEGAAYAADDNGNVRIHFTLSPEHIQPFKERLKRVQHKYERQYGVKYDIHWSVQKPATDTIAVTPDNLPFRESDGSLLFRPGGHGSLIENLNDLEEDMVFVKNIDNVVPDRLKDSTIRYKKILGGLLIQLREELTYWMKLLEKDSLNADQYLQAVDFAVNGLNIDPSVFPGDNQQGSRVLWDSLNRPLRVCGMVKNQGEPGGGPFWVIDPDKGFSSLQIAEKSQINLDDPEQANLLKESTHFNPVDLVCFLKDHNGNKFHLPHYVDHKTGFISNKSKDGKELKALERPGLWNGAMAHWNTVFVEVPLITFNPVKTINDLLRDEHQ